MIQEKFYLTTNILYFGLFFRLKFLENFFFRLKKTRIRAHVPKFGYPTIRVSTVI